MNKQEIKKVIREAANEGSGTYCNRGDVIEQLGELALRCLEHEENLKYLLDNTPGAIRVCEGGGLEDYAKSIAVTVVRLNGQLEIYKEANAKGAFVTSTT